MKCYFISSHFRRLYIYFKNASHGPKLGGNASLRTASKDPEFMGQTTEPGSALYRQPFFFFLFNLKWLYSHHLPDWPLDDFWLFPKIIKSTAFHGSHPPLHPKWWLGTEQDSQKDALQAPKTFPQEFQMFRGKNNTIRVIYDLPKRTCWEETTFLWVVSSGIFIFKNHFIFLPCIWNIWALHFMPGSQV